jgi:hypothetical protein
MKQLLLAAAIVAALAGRQASAHHSYAAYEMDRVVEIAGALEAFEVMAPHSLIKVKADDGRVVVAEWVAPVGLQRRGIDPSSLKRGDRIVVSGNPHREFASNGILNFKSVTRPSDGLTWAVPSRGRSR